jgi:predicted small lipoprotein YifL
MKTKFNLLFVIFTVAAIALSGCGKKPDQKTEGDKKDSTKQSTTNQNQVAGDNKPTNTDPKTNELGIKEGMPADYPKDVPQPLNSKCLGSLNTTEGTVVTFESTEKPKAILTPFSEAVEKAGFKKGEGEMMSDDGGMVMWKNDKREVSIMLAWDKEKSNSSVVVTYK